MIERVFVPGEPVLSGGRNQDKWQEAIRSAVTGSISSPMLTFVVSDLRRRGHPFDLDNLVHPVLMVFDEPIDQVSARLYLGSPAGLLIHDGTPAPVPPASQVHSILVAPHSETSVRDRLGIPEIANDAVLDEHEGLGLSLAFDRSDIPIRQGWFGPTEAVVDDLTPWLGTYTTRRLIADHRIRDLRIQRGINPAGRGVQISVWYVPDTQVHLPVHLRDELTAELTRLAKLRPVSP